MLRFKDNAIEMFSQIVVTILGYFLISYGASCIWSSSWAFALGCALFVNGIIKRS